MRLRSAIKYRSPERDPVIEISCKEDEHYCFFSVKDNGIGIEKQFYNRIFVIFQRLHGRKNYEGSGIDLAICKKIVERHQGEIKVVSTAGEGSTFIFSLKKQ